MFNQRKHCQEPTDGARTHELYLLKLALTFGQSAEPNSVVRIRLINDDREVSIETRPGMTRKPRPEFGGYVASRHHFGPFEPDEN